MPPVASTIDTLTEYADELLDLCETAVALTDLGAPSATFLASPGPAFDCDQLTVELISLGDAPFASTTVLGPGRRVTAAMNLVGFRIKIVRCVAMLDEQGNPPTPAAQRAGAVAGHQDVWAIWTAVRTAQREGTLFGGLCDHLFYDGARALDEQGGIAGYEIDFRAEIAGFANSGT